jgi:hypothetical protein
MSKQWLSFTRNAENAGTISSEETPETELIWPLSKIESQLIWVGELGEELRG